MGSTVLFDRRSANGLLTSSNPGDVFQNWKGDDERWLFLSPHDDDIICGCGLTFIASLFCGITTYAGVVTNGKMGYNRRRSCDGKKIYFCKAVMTNSGFCIASQFDFTLLF